MRHFSVELLKESPSPALRATHALAQVGLLVLRVHLGGWGMTTAVLVRSAEVLTHQLAVLHRIPGAMLASTTISPGRWLPVEGDCSVQPCTLSMHWHGVLSCSGAVGLVTFLVHMSMGCFSLLQLWIIAAGCVCFQAGHLSACSRSTFMWHADNFTADRDSCSRAA